MEIGNLGFKLDKNDITLGAFDAKLARSVVEADAGLLLSAAQVRRKFRLQ